jgi:hypothetical protein
VQHQGGRRLSRSYSRKQKGNAESIRRSTNLRKEAEQNSARPAFPCGGNGLALLLFFKGPKQTQVCGFGGSSFDAYGVSNCGPYLTADEDKPQVEYRGIAVPVPLASVYRWCYNGITA